MAKAVNKSKSVLFVRLDGSDRKCLDELVDSYPLIPRKKIREGKEQPYKISDADAVRKAIRDSHKQRCKKKRNAS